MPFFALEGVGLLASCHPDERKTDYEENDTPCLSGSCNRTVPLPSPRPGLRTCEFAESHRDCPFRKSDSEDR